MPEDEFVEDNFERFSNRKFQPNLRIEEEDDNEEDPEIPDGFHVAYGMIPIQTKYNWYWNNKIKNKLKQKTCGYAHHAKKKSNV